MQAIDSENRHLPNSLGIKGWVWAGRYTWERYLYTLHRLTGLGMLLFITIHLVINGTRLGGESSWTDVMDIFETPAFKVGEYLVVAAFIFHALNGGRLILQHMAYTLGKPKAPIYPYVDAMRKRRWLMWTVLFVIVVLAICALVLFVI
jgi:succinate dehydrogenase / fumarate reductase cytochrome b subunit